MRVLGVSTTSHPPHGAVMTTNEAALHKALLALYWRKQQLVGAIR